MKDSELNLKIDEICEKDPSQISKKEREVLVTYFRKLRDNIVEKEKKAKTKSDAKVTAANIDKVTF